MPGIVVAGEGLGPTLGGFARSDFDGLGDEEPNRGPL
jgi:hypothetical protein